MDETSNYVFLVLVQMLKKKNLQSACTLFSFYKTRLSSWLMHHCAYICYYQFYPTLLYSIFLGSGEAVALGDVQFVQCGY